MTTKQEWSNFCLSLALSDKRFTHRIRKIVPDVMFSTRLDKNIKVSDLGYSEGGYQDLDA